MTLTSRVIDYIFDDVKVYKYGHRDDLQFGIAA